MIDITREQLERLYKKQKTSFAVNFGLCIGAGLVTFILGRLHRNGITVPGYWIIQIAVLIIPVVSLIYFKNKLIPKENTSKKVIEAYRYLQNDFMSDNAVSFLYQKMGESSSFPEKTLIMMFLAEVYLFRGQIDESVKLINSVDRTQLTKYPSVGMTVYSDIIGCYLEVGDKDSVLAAYRDAEPFIRECSGRNYQRCSSAVDLLSDVYLAAGNYRKALDLVLMRNDFMNQFETTAKKASAQQTAPLNAFLRGIQFYRTAELYYLNGEYQNAAKSLDTGGPMLAASQYFLRKANELSAKISQIING